MPSTRYPLGGCARRSVTLGVHDEPAPDRALGHWGECPSEREGKRAPGGAAGERPGNGRDAGPGGGGGLRALRGAWERAPGGQPDHPAGGRLWPDPALQPGHLRGHDPGFHGLHAGAHAHQPAAVPQDQRAGGIRAHGSGGGQGGQGFPGTHQARGSFLSRVPRLGTDAVQALEDERGLGAGLAQGGAVAPAPGDHSAGCHQDPAARPAIP